MYLKQLALTSVVSFALGFLTSFEYPREADVRDVIPEDGYPLELHHVRTKDGYILELHRIPFGKNDDLKNRNSTKRVAVIAHCIACSSATSVMLRPNGSLAYTLANNGYDVWLINSRGNKYARRHESISPNNKKFWDFSFHENGVYDIPASLDYILNRTKVEMVDILGFSMGTTQYAVTLSEIPEYNKKIRNFISIAPAMFLSYRRATFRFIPPKLIRSYVETLKRMNLVEIPKPEYGIKHIITWVCRPHPIFNKLCDFLIKFFSLTRGFKYTKREYIPFYMSFHPEAMSQRTILHYYQITQTGEFDKYDFGPRKNLKMYGSPIPSRYNLSNISSKTHVIYSEGDDIAAPEDTEKFISYLPNVKTVHKILDKDFTHGDYIW